MPSLSRYGGTERWKFESTDYFRIERTDDRWWFVDPDGCAFLTIGIAHADDSDLKYAHNLELWKKKYGGSKDRWIKEGLVKDLKEWGFNTIGWTQDYVGGGWRKAFDWAERVTVQQSVQWSARDLQSADFPYVVLMRVAEMEDWNGDPVFPDVFSADFDDWCAFLARVTCVDHAESKTLLGYSYQDAPSWSRHVSGADFPQLQGLEGAARDEKLFDVASKYYETIHKYIRAYDTNHLILGDLYNGNRPLPDAVLHAMKPYVDVLGIQYFPGNDDRAIQEMKEHAARSSELTGKPLYIPDIGNWAPTKLNPHRVGDPTGRLAGMDSQTARAEHYIKEMSAVLHEPWFVGWHWCAYIENVARGWGVKDPWDEPYQDFVRPVSQFNKNVYDLIDAGLRSGNAGIAR